MPAPQRLFPIVFAFWAIGCATRGSVRTDQHYPSEPFQLELTVSPAEAEVGASLTIEYSLKNVTELAISACADAWDTYHIRGAKAEQGLVTTQLDRPNEDHIFRVPPGAKLVWKTAVIIRDIGIGEATLRGSFSSSCSSHWSGSVSSAPVKFVIKPKA